MKRPRRRENRAKLRRQRVPTESDWGNYHDDLDQEYSHRVFAGRTNEEMQSRFRNNVIETTDELRWMPKIPFEYYMIGFRDFIDLGDFGHPIDASDAASCFIRLVLEKLEGQPSHILAIMPDLVPTLEFVANNQAKFEAEEHIYGNFSEILNRIQTLHAMLSG
jgi:hypothetical protein